MSIQWRPQLSTGITWQDDQHKELLSKISDLFDAMEHNEAGRQIPGMLEFLKNYVAKHFDMEENYMRRSRDPDLPFHMAEHSRFLLKLDELDQHYRKQGASTYLIMQFQKWLRDWLIAHIIKTDHHMGDWIHEHPELRPKESVDANAQTQEKAS